MVICTLGARFFIIEPITPAPQPRSSTFPFILLSMVESNSSVPVSNSAALNTPGKLYIVKSCSVEC